jgi:hypothetical protein
MQTAQSPAGPQGLHSEAVECVARWLAVNATPAEHIDHRLLEGLIADIRRVLQQEDLSKAGSEDVAQLEAAVTRIGGSVSSSAIFPLSAPVVCGPDTWVRSRPPFKYW